MTEAAGERQRDPSFALGSLPCFELEEEPELKDIVDVIDNTTKTRAVFEINKGVNKFPDEITVNARMAHEDRRIPFENMIYVATARATSPSSRSSTSTAGRRTRSTTPARWRSSAK